MKKRIIFMFLIMAVSTQISLAEVVIINGNTVMQNLSLRDVIVVNGSSGNPTELNIFESYIQTLSCYDASVINLNLDAVVVNLNCYNQSNVNMNNRGGMDSITAINNSIVNFCKTGGSVQNIDGYDSATFNIDDNWHFGYATSYDSVTFNISGGGGGDLYTYGSTVVNMTGGWIGLTAAFDDSIINLSGADGFGGWIYCDGNSIVNIYGYGFTFEPFEDSNIDHDYGQLTGFWADGGRFSIPFESPDDVHEHIVLHEIPEPATVAFLGLGFFALRKKYKRSL